MSATIDPNLLDKIYPYLKAIMTCTGAKKATYKNVPDSCKSAVDAYLDSNNYSNSKTNKRGQIPVEFVEAFMAVLYNLKFVDPTRKEPVWTGTGKPLNDALKSIVWNEKDTDTTTKVVEVKNIKEVTQTGGGEELNKIIKLSKSEVSGFVPYHVNNIAGSYTDEYLNTLNSKIRKVDSQFGGFKKVTKEVIGSIEDLDRILRTELENQIDASVFKRYYKTYPIMSQKGGGPLIKLVWDWYQTKATDEERNVFDAYMEFIEEEKDMFKDIGNPRPGNKIKYGVTLDKDKFLRINLIKDGIGGYDAAYNPKIVNGRSVPLIILALPPNPKVLELALEYWFNTDDDNAAITDAVGFDAIYLASTGTARTNNKIDLAAKKLGDIMSCDDKMLKDFINAGPSVNEDDDDINPFATGDYNKYFKESGHGLLKNGWRWDRSTNTVQRKEKGKWVDYNPIDNPDEYKKIFNSAGKCFNSFIEFESKDRCCKLIGLLAEGKADDFFKQVQKDEVTVQQLDKSFDNVNPITVVKLLEGFKFQKQKTWVPVHGNVYKFPGYNWWAKNVIDVSDLTETEKKTIKEKPNLKDVLEMSVAFVNNNLNLLNPHITYDNTGLNSGTPDKKLEQYNVQRYLPNVVPETRSYDRYWWSKARRQIENASLPHRRNMPFYPLLGGQQFVLSGGSDNKKTEIVLDNTDIVPQFATQIRDDLKLLVENLKSKNKTLSPKEMEKLNKELEDFRKSEVNLINKVLLINKYLKISNLLPENEREYITENKMTKLISDYYENFKDYADKDLELKGIGSYIRSVLSNDNL